MKSISTLILIGIFIILGLSTTTSAQSTTNKESVNPEKVKDIKRLIAITSGENLVRQMMNHLISSFKTSLPQVPEQYWDNFIKEVNENELIERLIPIYERHLTHEDIKGLINFYETPTGQRVLKALPEISKESFTIGQSYGREVGEKIIKKLREDGYKIPGN
ncbi:MAG: DUF2059 domain-containing protein [Acidobacteriota bacterium]